MERPSVDLKIPSATLFKVFLAFLLVGVLYNLAQLLTLLFLSALVAVTLYPMLNWLEKRLPRWLAILIVTFGLLFTVSAFFVFILPSLVDQISNFLKNLPQLKEKISAEFPPGSLIGGFVQNLMRGEGIPKESALLDHAVFAGQFVLSGLAGFAAFLILALYLVIDGPRTWTWFVAFFAPAHRLKLHKTGREVSAVIFAYVAGQVITSVLVFIFSFLWLRFLHVPAALTLAAMGAVFDVLPVLGLVLSAGPATLLALTVSPITALIVLGLYVAYHSIESYFIVPKVYGKRLRLSTLNVLVSLLAADLLAGVLGAVAILPIVASYPIIERIWLAPFLRDSTVEKHAEQEEELGGDKK